MSVSNSSLLRWHRRIGLLAAIGVVVWGLSGIGHPLMSRINPQPAAFQPPTQSLPVSAMLSLAEAAKLQGIDTLERARLLMWDGQPWYRLQTPAEVVFINALSGEHHTDGERAYAEWLARYYLGDNDSRIRESRPLDSFDNDYPPVNRLLPVYRMDFERADAMRVYVDTRSGQLGALVDTRKAVTSYWFSQLHSWQFIASEPLRYALMTLLLLAALSTAFLGLWQFLRQRPRQRQRTMSRTRRIHRSLGAALALVLLIFSSTGLYHLWHMRGQAELPVATFAPFAAPQLSADWYDIAMDLPPVYAAELVMVDAEPWYRLELARDDIRYAHAISGAFSDQATRHARELAQQFSGLPAQQITGTVRIDRFAGDYGFINKRLPVYAVHYDTAGSPSFYIDLRAGVLASRVVNADRLERYSFSWLHKWGLLDFMGRNLRDTIAAGFALGLVLIALLGAGLYSSHRLRRR